MTLYTLSPNSATSTGSWDDPSNWSPQGVPNAGTAEVLMTEVTNPLSGNQVASTISIETGQSFQVDDLDIVAGAIYNSGTLQVIHSVTIGANGGFFNYAMPGSLSAASFENDGSITSTGPYMISGLAINRGSLYGSFTVTAGTFDNAGGTMQSTGSITIAGSFANLTSGTLTGGTYYPLNGSITVETNGPITTLAAIVSLGNGTLQTYAASGTSLVTLQSSLTTVAPSGYLSADSYANANPLSVAGTLWCDGSFSAPSLTVTPTGSITLVGQSAATLSASGGIVDNGIILAAVGDGESNSAVVIGAAVQGTGTIVLGPSTFYINTAPPSTQTLTVSLELTAADTANILFADASSTLTLDAPQSVSATIQGFSNGDTIVLSGISLSTVTGTSYSGDATHGTLTITQSGGPTIALAFQGNYTTADFSLTAGTVQLGSTPATVVLTVDTAMPNAGRSLVDDIAAGQAGTLAPAATIIDDAADIVSHLDGLQTLAAAGGVTHVFISGTDVPGGHDAFPLLTVTATQFLSDSAALSVIDSAHEVSVTGATVSQAESIAGGAHVTSIAVSDSAADIAPQIDALAQLAATGQISSVAVTDSGFTTFFLSATQLANDRALLGEMSGNFNLTVSASGANLELDGVAGHAMTAVFSGTASQYVIASAGDGVGVTITQSGGSDLLRSVSAVQFSDVTDLIARTPGSGAAGSVTTGNVTELYGAVFGRLPDLPGLAYYQTILEQNPSLPLTTFAQWFLASPEYVNNAAHDYAQSSAGDTQFIDDSYTNLLHRAPESGAVPYYLNIIQSFTNGFTPGTQAYAIAQAQAHAVVLTDFSASAEFLQDVQVTAQTPSSAQHWLILI